MVYKNNNKANKPSNDNRIAGILNIEKLSKLKKILAVESGK